MTKLDVLGRELLDLQLELPEYQDLHSREFLLRDMARLAERLGDASRAAIYIKEADEIKRFEAVEEAKIAHLPIIYVDLLEEGTVCWREIRAEHIRDNIYIKSSAKIAVMEMRCGFLIMEMWLNVAKKLEKAINPHLW